jgi:hypothetical protein
MAEGPVRSFRFFRRSVVPHSNDGINNGGVGIAALDEGDS